jgi:twitching motility protein PilT
MDQCLRDLYMKGVITLEEALLRCMNADELKKMINLGGAAGQQGGGAQPQRR